MKTSCLVATACLLIATSPAHADAVQDELKKLDGTWRVVAIEVDGKPIPAEVIRARNETFTFKDGVLIQRTDKPEENRIPIKVDPGKSPKTIDLGSGEDKALSNVAIYELKDDQLVICFSKDRKTRPTELKAPAGANALLVTCRR